MAPKNGTQTREVRDVVRDHVMATLEANPGLPKWRLAAELGMHPNTLARLLKKWSESDETLVRDRR